MIFKIKIGVILLTLLISFLYFFTGPVIEQPQDYHQFADQRLLWGVANAFDVLSNLAFLVAGYLGLREILKNQKNLISYASWKWFFIAIILIAPGSAYYHLAPNDGTLIWDRLPMSLGFMALYVALFTEHISLKSERFLPLALLLGLVSVLTWVVTSDLRFYFWVQFSSFLTIPVILIFFRSYFTQKYWYGVTLVCYLLAKITEVKDHEIFAWTGENISGHTLKHLLAALGLAFLWWMLKKRSARS